MEFVVVCLVALGASALTLFSGFGLGTLLLPAFALFFPTGIAVAVTAVVHLANNLFKAALLGRHADRAVLRRFAVPAILASLLGARMLVRLSLAEPLATYTLFGNPHEITGIGLVVGALIAMFALWESVPRLARVSFGPQYLAVGGGLSGFFGGLSGHQGALRSAFLIRCGLSREAFIGTGVVVACLVDATRLLLYGREIGLGAVRGQWPLMAAAIVSAITGAAVGARLMPRVSMTSVRRFVAAMLLAMAVLVATGIV
jgi:uncharacterized membrane protein YfcA